MRDVMSCYFTIEVFP